jgi:hypothetical protein
MEMGRAGRRGLLFPKVDEAVSREVGAAEALIPASMRRKARPALPELSEPEVLHHYTIPRSPRSSLRGPSSLRSILINRRRRCKACSRSCTAST